MQPLLRWYAVDVDGCVGLFESDDGVIPRAAAVSVGSFGEFDDHELLLRSVAQAFETGTVVLGTRPSGVRVPRDLQRVVVVIDPSHAEIATYRDAASTFERGAIDRLVVVRESKPRVLATTRMLDGELAKLLDRDPAVRAWIVERDLPAWLAGTADAGLYRWASSDTPGGYVAVGAAPRTPTRAASDIAFRPIEAVRFPFRFDDRRSIQLDAYFEADARFSPVRRAR